MKVMFLIFICCFSFSALSFAGLDISTKEKIALDRNGFVTCYQHKEHTYFFNWDRFSKVKKKEVSYFELRDYVQSTSHFILGCEDFNYLHEVPNQILHDIAEIKSELPSQVVFSAEQIQQGAHLFRTEKSAKQYLQNRSVRFQKNQPEVLSQLRYEVGDAFAKEVMQEFSNMLFQNIPNCQALIGNCDFYLCQEQKKGCDLDGYNLSFGYKYCSKSKFKLREQMETDFGRQWVEDVLICLQQESDQYEQSESKLTCSGIKNHAFASHPHCYVQAGFCSLQVGEKAKLFNMIKNEILSSQTLLQGLNIISDCSAKIKN